MVPQVDEINNSVTEALVALGANLPLGEAAPEAVLRRALTLLDDRETAVAAVSPFYRTPAYPSGSGPDFVNAAALLRTTLAAAELLARLHAVEARLGRTRKWRWEPRVVDLDLLAMGDAILPDAATQSAWAGLSPEAQRASAPDRLILPHPRLQERGFVLVPLADVAADWRHPVLGRTVAEMLAALPVESLSGIVPLDAP